MSWDQTSLTDDEEVMLEVLPEDGNGVTNPRLKEELGWDDERYYTARDRLVDVGLVSLGRGRGGVVRRAPPTQPAEKVPMPVDSDLDDELGRGVPATERSLYDPMRRVIAGEWAKDKRFDPLAVEVTAQQGRRETGGRFTRPDIVAVEVKTFRYLPGKTLEVITFEVKPFFALDVTFVYEALAHRGAATRSYVLLHVPEPSSRQAELEAIEQAARDHRIGLIVAEDASSYASWETRFDAVRVEPDPGRLDGFIHTQLSERTKDRIRLAVR